MTLNKNFELWNWKLPWWTCPSSNSRVWSKTFQISSVPQNHYQKRSRKMKMKRDRESSRSRERERETAWALQSIWMQNFILLLCRVGSLVELMEQLAVLLIRGWFVGAAAPQVAESVTRLWSWRSLISLRTHRFPAWSSERVLSAPVQHDFCLSNTTQWCIGRSWSWRASTAAATLNKMRRWKC
jgi:hypothetical protein